MNNVPVYNIIWNIDFNLRWKMAWPDCEKWRFSNSPETECYHQVLLNVAELSLYASM